jgi:hypothetical protein
MITMRIKALFQFIEYLHSNIDNFNLNNDLIKELELLGKERKKVNHKSTFKDKLKYDELQAEIETKFRTLQDNTANLIKAKAKELNVCNFDNERIYSFKGIETDIHQLKENFSKDDLPEIFKHKQQYIEYRTKTHKTFLSLEDFINELDEVTKSLFDYFKETDYNEFEAFENKTVQANNIPEMMGFLNDKKAVKISFRDVLKSIRDMQDSFILLGDNEKEKNRILEKRFFENKNNILSKQISEIGKLPHQDEKHNPSLKFKDFFIKEVSDDTITAIQTEFNELEGKDLAILIYLLHKENKIIEILTNSKTKGRKGFVKCLKETDNPAMQKVNKCFIPNTDDLIYSEDDLVFRSLNKRLTEKITNTVV